VRAIGDRWAGVEVPDGPAAAEPAEQAVRDGVAG
jgi:hypothetical protein